MSSSIEDEALVSRHQHGTPMIVKITHWYLIVSTHGIFPIALRSISCTTHHRAASYKHIGRRAYGQLRTKIPFSFKQRMEQYKLS